MSQVELSNNEVHTDTNTSHEVTLFAEPVIHVGNFVITNSLFSGWLVVVIVIVLSFIARMKISRIPGKLQSIFEIVIEGALDLCDQVTGQRILSLKVFPVVFSVFIFVLLNNWLGLLPGVGSIGFYEMHEGVNTFVPLFRGGTADINTTLALGFLAVIGSNIFGVIVVGFWKTFNKYINLVALSHMITKVRKDPAVLIVSPIIFFVGLIEAVGEFAKVASLSFRLFGNIFAGEVLLMSMAMIMKYLVPVPFLFLEVFVGLIQALIFSLLSLVYFTIASHDHSEHEESHESKQAHT